MKKALALVLASAMALGMSATAFASIGTAAIAVPVLPEDWDDAIALEETPTGGLNYADGAAFDEDGKIAFGLVVEPEEGLVDTIDITDWVADRDDDAEINSWTNITVSSTIPSALGTVSYDGKTGTIKITYKTSYGYTDATADTTKVPDWTITAKLNSVSQKLTFTTYVLNGTSSSSTTTTSKYVNTTTKAKNFASGMSLAYGYENDLGRTGINHSYDLGTIRPADDEKIKIWLYAEMFEELSGFSGRLGSQTVRTSKITARTQIAEGSKAIRDTDIQYDGGQAYIRVRFIKEHVSTKEVDFNFTVYLTLDGKRRDADGQGVNFYGTLENYIILVYANDDYVDTSLGEVAHAQDFVSDIEVDLGNGVSIYTKMFKDKKYYGTATRDADEYADVVFSKYPDVDNVVIMKTVGLNSTGDIVKLNTDYSDYWVYDKDMNYLGQSSDKLRFSERYYLANKKLNIADDSGDDGDEPGDEPSDYVEPGDTGGDSGLSNANANPGTGR